MIRWVSRERAWKKIPRIKVGVPSLGEQHFAQHSMMVLATFKMSWIFHQSEESLD